MTENLKGILAILGSSAAFVGNDALTKLVTAELPIGELIAIRGAMASLLIGGVAWWWGSLRPLAVFRDPALNARVVIASISTIFIVLSLKYLPLAIVNAVLQMAPLAVTAGSALLLHESVGWRRWAAAIAGFVGVVMIVQPMGGGEVAAYGWIAVMALLFTAARDLVTRVIDKAIPGMLISFASTVLITGVGFLFWPFETWIRPSHRALALLVLASVFLLFAYNLIVYAVRTGEIAVVAPFRYSLILLALPVGWWGWGDVPNELASAGIALVIAAGVYMLHRERVAAKSEGARARVGVLPAPAWERPIT